MRLCHEHFQLFLFAFRGTCTKVVITVPAALADDLDDAMSTLGIASKPSAGRPATESKILIRGARQVVTLQGPARMRVGAELEEPGVLRDASVLIDGGRIVQLGSARRVDNLRETQRVRRVDARHLVVIPGFVDAATSLLPEDAEGEESAWGGPALPSRRVSQELQRLALAGSTFVRASFLLPAEESERSRLIRHLLRVEVPASAFQVLLRVNPQWLGEAGGRAASVRELFPSSSRQHLRELLPLMAIGFAAGALRELAPGQRFQLLRGIARALRVEVYDGPRFRSAEFLELGLAAACLASGELPGDTAELEQLAQLGQPWVVEAGPLALQGSDALERLPRAIRVGMRVAVATGYQCGKPGVCSPLALLALLRQQTGLSLPALLQTQIANAAHAFGVGDRMGSLEAGKEANLLLVDCDDYRELGVAVGAPRIVGVMRRGRWLGGDQPPFAQEDGEA